MRKTFQEKNKACETGWRETSLEKEKAGKNECGEKESEEEQGLRETRLERNKAGEKQG